MPKNEPKKVKISIWSLLHWISEKVAENRKGQKMKFSLFMVHFQAPKG